MKAAVVPECIQTSLGLLASRFTCCHFEGSTTLCTDEQALYLFLQGYVVTLSCFVMVVGVSDIKNLMIVIFHGWECCSCTE